jgi:uncharacterized protein (UPF0297 family)
MKKLFLIPYFLFIVFILGCKLDKLTSVYAPPVGLRVITNSDTTPGGTQIIPSTMFTKTTAITTNFSNYCSNTKWVGNTTNTNYVAVEFYGYNKENGFTGYNLYVVGNSTYADETDARAKMKEALYLYNYRKNLDGESNVVPSVYINISSPGSIIPAAASYSSVYFSSYATRFVIAFNEYADFSSNFALTDIAGGLTLYIIVTAVNTTSDALNESEPSMAIKVVI